MVVTHRGRCVWVPQVGEITTCKECKPNRRLDVLDIRVELRICGGHEIEAVCGRHLSLSNVLVTVCLYKCEVVQPVNEEAEGIS